MSLILDALRKADSERERESVPGLHTQPVPPLSLEMPAPARPRPVLWIALGIGVGLLAAVAWYLLGREPVQAQVERAAAPSPAPVVAPAVAPVAPAKVETPPVEVAAPAPWPAPENRKGARAPAKAEPAPTVAVAAAETPIYPREQLPDNIRAALPPLAVGGSIYSNTPANRSLILDGRLYRESDTPAADLVLEEIGLKTAVLRFRGYRFQIRY